MITDGKETKTEQEAAGTRAQGLRGAGLQPRGGQRDPPLKAAVSAPGPSLGALQISERTELYSGVHEASGSSRDIQAPARPPATGSNSGREEPSATRRPGQSHACPRAGPATSAPRVPGSCSKRGQQLWALLPQRSRSGERGLPARRPESPATRRLRPAQQSGREACLDLSDAADAGVHTGLRPNVGNERTEPKGRAGRRPGARSPLAAFTSSPQANPWPPSACLTQNSQPLSHGVRRPRLPPGRSRRLPTRPRGAGRAPPAKALRHEPFPDGVSPSLPTASRSSSEKPAGAT